MHVPGGAVLEQDSTGEVYEKATNTLYAGPQVPNGTPRYTLRPTGGRGRYRMLVRLPHGGVYSQTLDTSTVKALRDGDQTVQWGASWNGHTQQIVPLIMPSARELRKIQAQEPSPALVSFATQLHALLESGHARVTRTTTADGQPASEIASVHPQSGPRTNYYVNPTPTRRSSWTRSATRAQRMSPACT